jgi:hypothetical protein
VVSSRLSRIIPMFATMILLYMFVVNPLHEAGHNLVATWTGVPGHVDFGLTWARFTYDIPLADVGATRDALIGFGGGFIVAAVFGFLWLLNWWQAQFSDGALDETFVYGILTVFQIVYGFAEGVEWWFGSTDWSYPVGLVLALGITGWLYANRIMDWWTKE